MANGRCWYEICVEWGGVVREVEVRGNQEGAVRQIEELRKRWPLAERIFVRRHRMGGKFIVLHKLTWRL